MIASNINAASKRHQDVTLLVQPIDNRMVSVVGDPHHTKIDGIALLQILNSHGEDTLNDQTLIAQLY